MFLLSVILHYNNRMLLEIRVTKKNLKILFNLGNAFHKTQANVVLDLCDGSAMDPHNIFDKAR